MWSSARAPLGGVAIVLAVALTAASCGDDESLSAWCGLVAGGAVVPLGAADAPEQWARLEDDAPADLRPDVERLRVAADQLSEVDPADLTSAAQLVLTPTVLTAHRDVTEAIGSRCRIDVSTLTVIDGR